MCGVLNEIELPVGVGEPEMGAPRGAEIDATHVHVTHLDGEEGWGGDRPTAKNRGKHLSCIINFLMYVLNSKNTEAHVFWSFRWSAGQAFAFVRISTICKGWLREE